MPDPKGLLLVAMEPPAPLEDEFNDWYDTEHTPQRRALPGFESASRWVCLVGWPRWLALYDMSSPAAVDTPEYRAVSGANGTPWSRRILPRTVGRERVVARQLAPGSALARPVAEVARLVAARYPGKSDPDAVHALAERAGALPGLLQFRAFAALEAFETWVLAEYGRPLPQDRAVEAFAALGEGGATTLNLYAPYRRGPAT
jgi:hypothetical protein